MSTARTITPMALQFVGQRTRAYFAPNNRVAARATIFDPAQNASWNFAAPPAPWVDLGWIYEFTRKSESVIAEIDSGVPPIVQVQTRQKIGATVSFAFATWTKLTMALSAGSQHMNVLAAASGSTAIGSGAKAIPAVALQASSSANVLYAAAAGSAIGVGSVVVVDQDYTGQTGFVGTPVSAAYVQSAASVGNDPDTIRRVSFNVGRVISIGSDGGFHLAAALPGGVPTSLMKLQQVVGLVDREGGSFFQEWSALFITQGVQGDRLCYHYPRLQPCAPASEGSVAMASPLSTIRPAATFRALAVTDGNDGEQVVCYRTYYPGAVSFI